MLTAAGTCGVEYEPDDTHLVYTPRQPPPPLYLGGAPNAVASSPLVQTDAATPTLAPHPVSFTATATGTSTLPVVVDDQIGGLVRHRHQHRRHDRRPKLDDAPREASLSAADVRVDADRNAIDLGGGSPGECVPDTAYVASRDGELGHPRWPRGFDDAEAAAFDVPFTRATRSADLVDCGHRWQPAHVRRAHPPSPCRRRRCDHQHTVSELGRQRRIGLRRWQVTFTVSVPARMSRRWIPSHPRSISNMVRLPGARSVRFTGGSNPPSPPAIAMGQHGSHDGHGALRRMIHRTRTTVFAA